MLLMGSSRSRSPKSSLPPASDAGAQSLDADAVAKLGRDMAAVAEGAPPRLPAITSPASLVPELVTTPVEIAELKAEAHTVLADVRDLVPALPVGDIDLRSESVRAILRAVVVALLDADASHDVIGKLVDRAGAAHAGILGKWEPLTGAAFALHKGLVARRTDDASEAALGLALGKALLREWTLEVDERVRIAEEKARRQREWVESWAAACREAEVAAERDRLAAEQERIAREYELQGQAELAAEIRSEPPPDPEDTLGPAPVPEPVVADVPFAAARSAAGTATVRGWDWTLDPSDGSGVKAEFRVPDGPAITKIVDAMGPRALAVVGGIRVTPSVDVRRTGRRR
jgi:hypothetical protein